MGIFSYNKHLNFKENMWKLKLKVCLINFLAYSLCTFLLYLCFQRQALYRPGLRIYCHRLHVQAER